MTTLKEYNSYGEDLERMLLLRTSPLAVKMLEKEEDIPEGAIRPKKDRGYHLAQCQAFAMARRERVSVAMLEEDNWCFAPVIAYGMEEKPDDPRLEQIVAFPCLERNRYIGIVSAPLKTANFEPDLVLIYSNTAQMRSLLLTLKYENRDQISYYFFPPVCSYIVIPVMLENRYVVALPDPGEFVRAISGEDEIIISIPAGKIDELMANLRKAEERNMGYSRSSYMMLHDFPRPDFYKNLFRKWGMDVED